MRQVGIINLGWITPGINSFISALSRKVTGRDILLSGIEIDLDSKKVDLNDELLDKWKKQGGAILQNSSLPDEIQSKEYFTGYNKLIVIGADDAFSLMNKNTLMHSKLKN